MRLTLEEKNEIADTIRSAEQRTSGEIVFAIADASGQYHHATLQGALAGTVVAAAVYLALPLPHTIGLLLWTEIISFAFFYGFIPFLPFRRWFIPAREREESVREAAFREFYSNGLYQTREANGVVIYLSFLERSVVVLGDRGIHEKMGNLQWEEVRNAIIRGIRQGKAKDGICRAVEICGRTLAEHFPRCPDDVDELPNHVIDRTAQSRD